MTSTFKGKRETLTHVMTIDSTPEEVFPLLCPVRETEWVDEWVGRPVFSSSGYAEENGVFASEHADGEDTIWYVTKHDHDSHEIEYLAFVPKIQLLHLFLRITPAEGNQSRLSIRYIRTGISEEGNRAVERAPEAFPAMMRSWEASLNHYLRTGESLKKGS